MSAPTTLDDAPTTARLLVLRRPSVDTEGPYAAECDDVWSDGALALDRTRRVGACFAAPERTSPLRLVPDPDDGSSDRTAAAAGEGSRADDESEQVTFSAVRTPRSQLPALGPHATTLVRAVLEVLAGDRPLRQLARCTSPAVYDELELLVSPAAPRPWAGTVRRVLLSEPLPGIAEVTAIVVHGARTLAVALRLEGVDGRWQLTALQLV